MAKRKDRVCPVELAGSLDTWFRRLMQNPSRILGPYVSEGMTALDFGCGPGFFTIEMARMVGSSGMVYAADLQEGMLKKLKMKALQTGLDKKITPHHTSADTIGLSVLFDFVLAFYVLHELPDQEQFFTELAVNVKPGGIVLAVEPTFHVSKNEYWVTIEKAERAGFVVEKGPRILLCRTVLLRKNKLT